MTSGEYRDGFVGFTLASGAQRGTVWPSVNHDTDGREWTDCETSVDSN